MVLRPGTEINMYLVRLLVHWQNMVPLSSRVRVTLLLD